jgi:hypothetical protein
MRNAIVLAGIAAMLMITEMSSCQPEVQVGGGKVKPGDWEKAQADPWVRQLRGSGDPLEDNPRANISAVCFVVIEAKRAEALALLDAHPAVEITPDQWSAFVGFAPAFEPVAEKLVLLRCAQVTPEPSELLSTETVEWNSGSVHVVSLALRNTYVPVEHTAVVAVLPGLPRHVFVDMYTAIY